VLEKRFEDGRERESEREREKGNKHDDIDEM